MFVDVRWPCLVHLELAWQAGCLPEHRTYLTLGASRADKRVQTLQQIIECKNSRREEPCDNAERLCEHEEHRCTECRLPPLERMKGARPGRQAAFPSTIEALPRER